MMGRFARWLRARKLAAKIRDYEHDLAAMRELRDHIDQAEVLINDELQRTKVALYHAQRKGTV